VASISDGCSASWKVNGIDYNEDDLTLCVYLDGTRIASSNATVTVSELSSSKAKGTFSGDFFDIMDLTFDPIYSVSNGTFEANF